MNRKKENKKQAEKKIPSAAAQAPNPERWKYYSALLVILILSFIAYLPVLNNALLSWDDNRYIKDNPLIYSFNLKEIFSQYVMSNYHPVTILTLSIEYHFFGLNETGYHSVNLLLHLLNVVIVFYSVFLLSEKAGVALVASLLFGIHPIHVESVAWAAELKDLLYTFFFLASYIFYLKYLKDPQKKFYIFSLLLFSVSLLAKAMAASLPIVLLLTDYFKGKKMNLKTVLEKVPYFLLALTFGVVAVLAQKSGGDATDEVVFTFPQHMVFACYGFITYLFKLVLPIHLSAYYPYPVKSGADIPIQYYAYALSFLLLAAYVFYSLRSSKKIIFGIGFFAATVLLVLQLLPVGGAIMADRYSYIPSIGIFYLAGEGFILLWNKKIKWAGVILLSAYTVFFTVKTYARCSVWKNEMSLWNDVISQYETVPIAYNNRGTVFMNEKKYDRALADYNKAIELNSEYSEAYSNRGFIFMNQKRYNEALDDFNKTIELNTNFPDVFVNRGNVLRDTHRYDEALKDYEKAIELKPDFPIAYFNRGTLFMTEKRNAEALNDFNKAIELKPNYFQAYHNRGNIFYNEKKYEEAISNYSKAIELKADNAESYYIRGMSEYYSGKKDAACIDLKQAADFGYKPATEIILQICK